MTAAVMLLCFRVSRTPPQWRATAAVAMTAPALVLDMVATTFYGDWFGDAGPAEPAAYSATILGGTGVVLLVALAMTARRTGSAAKG